MTDSRKPYAEKSFIEALVTDAFHTGVHPQSFDAINYAVVGLTIVGSVSIYMSGSNYHLIGLMLLAGILAVLLNIYRDDFLEASRKHEDQQKKESGVVEVESEYEYVDEDEEEGEISDDHTAEQNGKRKTN